MEKGSARQSERGPKRRTTREEREWKGLQSKQRRHIDTLEKTPHLAGVRREARELLERIKGGHEEYQKRHATELETRRAKRKSSKS